jgi:hypothetical protein
VDRHRHDRDRGLQRLRFLILMGHDFKPVTVGESLQVAILDELQKITSLLEPSRDPVVTEPPEPEPPADAPVEDKPEPKAPAKKTQRRQTKVDGR